MHWHLKREPFQLPQPRVRFVLAGQQYDLPVTDPACSARLIRKLSEEKPGFYSHEKLALAEGPVLITVSLSEPFNGYCYKLAAAIIEIASLAA